ncbi:MAG: hypothetical protein AB9869_16645 [Verrucomicrobiia bacterium]
MISPQEAKLDFELLVLQQDLAGAKLRLAQPVFAFDVSALKHPVAPGVKQVALSSGQRSTLLNLLG